MADYRDPTPAEKTSIERISGELKTVIGVYGLHPKVQASLADLGYLTIDMLSGCFSTQTELIAEAPGEFSFAIRNFGLSCHAPIASLACAWQSGKGRTHPQMRIKTS